MEAEVAIVAALYLLANVVLVAAAIAVAVYLPSGAPAGRPEPPDLRVARLDGRA